MIVENLPVPFDRRVWQEASALKAAGYVVSVICPKGKGHNVSYEQIDGICIYRHPLSIDAAGAVGFVFEYATALFWELALTMRVFRRKGFDVIHACNPPDLIFLIGQAYKILFAKKFVFDHHDLFPELYEVKFGRRGIVYQILRLCEKLTFRAADVSIATNEKFKEIAVTRGGMTEDRVWVVKSYPDLDRFHRTEGDPVLRNGRRCLIGYVGIMGNQDGVDQLVLAMRHIVQTRGRTDIQCLIIGDGPERAALQGLTERHGLEDFITFPGHLTGDALLRHLSSLDVGVMPDPSNSFNDKLSMNKVFEYMVLGIPFVMYNLQESVETAGEAAIVAREHTPESLGDAALILADDPQRRRRMGEYGISIARETFRWEREKDKLLQAYQVVFSG